MILAITLQIFCKRMASRLRRVFPCRKLESLALTRIRGKAESRLRKSLKKCFKRTRNGPFGGHYQGTCIFLTGLVWRCGFIPTATGIIHLSALENRPSALRAKKSQEAAAVVLPTLPKTLLCLTFT
ncbi:MAG: hypothetical protein QGG48_10445, partial [Desulfatiglandales bacterium]|nr:hypothetical protein [Desulfatiglandales bacterium]